MRLLLLHRDERDEMDWYHLDCWVGYLYLL
jgi:hypothetical protein